MLTDTSFPSFLCSLFGLSLLETLEFTLDLPLRLDSALRSSLSHAGLQKVCPVLYCPTRCVQGIPAPYLIGSIIVKRHPLTRALPYLIACDRRNLGTAFGSTVSSFYRLLPRLSPTASRLPHHNCYTASYILPRTTPLALVSCTRSLCHGSHNGESASRPHATHAIPDICICTPLLFLSFAAGPSRRIRGTCRTLHLDEPHIRLEYSHSTTFGLLFPQTLSTWAEHNPPSSCHPTQFAVPIGPERQKTQSTK